MEDLREGRTHNIGGVSVQWPADKTPFGSQFAVMGRMVTALRKGQNALVESPTGTGKTLALLCAALSWQADKEAALRLQLDDRVRQEREKFEKDRRENEALEEEAARKQKQKQNDDKDRQNMCNIVVGATLTAIRKLAETHPQPPQQQQQQQQRQQRRQRQPRAERKPRKRRATGRRSNTTNIADSIAAHRSPRHVHSEYATRKRERPGSVSGGDRGGGGSSRNSGSKDTTGDADKGAEELEAEVDGHGEGEEGGEQAIATASARTGRSRTGAGARTRTRSGSSGGSRSHSQGVARDHGCDRGRGGRARRRNRQYVDDEEEDEEEQVQEQDQGEEAAGGKTEELSESQMVDLVNLPTDDEGDNAGNVPADDTEASSPPASQRTKRRRLPPTLLSQQPPALQLYTSSVSSSASSSSAPTAPAPRAPPSAQESEEQQLSLHMTAKQRTTELVKALGAPPEEADIAEATAKAVVKEAPLTNPAAVKAAYNAAMRIVRHSAASDKNAQRAATAQGDDPAAVEARIKKSLLAQVPRIYFASRTHSQLEQVLAELSRCPRSLIYRSAGEDEPETPLRMVLLSSRKKSCVHPSAPTNLQAAQDSYEQKRRVERAVAAALGAEGADDGGAHVIDVEDVFSALATVDAELGVDLEPSPPEQSLGSTDDYCRAQLEHGQCGFYHSANRVLPALRSPVWDLGAIRAAAEETGGCAYFAAREAAKEANIVFCPYNYILDPAIREAMKINLEGSVVILDEAHNVESVARDSATGEFSLGILTVANRELSTYLRNNPDDTIFNMLHVVVRGLQDWIDQAVSAHDNSGGGGGGGWRSSRGGGYRGRGRGGSGGNSSINRGGFSGAQAADNGAQADAGPSADQLRNVVDWWTGEQAVTLLGEHCHARPETIHTMAECFHNLLTSGETEIEEGMGRQENERGQIRPEGRKLSSALVSVLTTFFGVAPFLLDPHMRNTKDFRVLVERRNGPRSRHTSGRSFEYHLQFLCLSASVALRDLEHHTGSLILTSGTLSPFHTMETELGVHFPITLEAPHVIDTGKQVWASCVKAYHGHMLNSTFKFRETTAFQDRLGDLIADTLLRVPDGVVVFVSSYSFLETLRERWEETGHLERMGRVKKVFWEPKEARHLPFVLAQYYGVSAAVAAKFLEEPADTSTQKLQQQQQSAPGPATAASAAAAAAAAAAAGGRRRYDDDEPPDWEEEPDDLFPVSEQPASLSQNTAVPGRKRCVTGAVLFGVYRGKVSEGIDFADHNARCVIAVGIPFAALNSPFVVFKRHYQDCEAKGLGRQTSGAAPPWVSPSSSSMSASAAAMYPRLPGAARQSSGEASGGGGGGGGGFMAPVQAARSTPHAMDGDQWYAQQAHRALNQAIGRCIRHRNDFGAILLVDPRFAQEGSQARQSLSKWTRDHFRVYHDGEQAMESLQTFFDGLRHERIMACTKLCQSRGVSAASLITLPPASENAAVAADADAAQAAGAKANSLHAYFPAAPVAEAPAQTASACIPSTPPPAAMAAPSLFPRSFQGLWPHAVCVLYRALCRRGLAIDLPANMELGRFDDVHTHGLSDLRTLMTNASEEWQGMAFSSASSSSSSLSSPATLGNQLMQQMQDALLREMEQPATVAAPAASATPRQVRNPHPHHVVACSVSEMCAIGRLRLRTEQIAATPVAATNPQAGANAVEHVPTTDWADDVQGLRLTESWEPDDGVVYRQWRAASKDDRGAQGDELAIGIEVVAATSAQSAALNTLWVLPPFARALAMACTCRAEDESIEDQASQPSQNSRVSGCAVATDASGRAVHLHHQHTGAPRPSGGSHQAVDGGGPRELSQNSLAAPAAVSSAVGHALPMMYTF